MDRITIGAVPEAVRGGSRSGRDLRGRERSGGERPGRGARRASGAAALACAAAALLASAAADAARFGVRVVDGSGLPVVGASVCIGLEGNYRQFGTAFTDARGQVELVEVPAVPFVVTVSKSRFSGVRRSEPARGFDLVSEITLTEGKPGPRCKAGSTVVANPPRIEVLDVDIDGDDSSMSLTPSVTGEPSHYRVARDDGFEGAGWQPFERTIALPGPLADAGSLYLQLRRFEGSSDAWLEARSDVVTVRLPRR